MVNFAKGYKSRRKIRDKNFLLFLTLSLNFMGKNSY